MLQRAATTQATPELIEFNRALRRSFDKPENDLRQLAPRIQAPVLFVFGKHDPAIRASRDGKTAAQCVPSARLVVLPSGHEPFAEIPDLFLAEVQPFLARHGNSYK